MLTTVLVQVRELPVPIWLPMPSVCLWALTVDLGLLLCCLPAGFLRRHLGEKLPVSPRQVGWQLIRLATILLWSGSFVLCDVSVPEEGVRVRIRSY